jgi:hypothetical protein
MVKAVVKVKEVVNIKVKRDLWRWFQGMAVLGKGVLMMVLGAW